MIRTLNAILLMWFIVCSKMFAQAPTNQDCLGAIAICQNIYAESNAFSGTGNFPNEIDTAKSCLKSGEKNDVFYTFTVQTSGQLCFTITPNLATDDYDWAVYNLSSANCSDIFTNGALEVSCNFAPDPGATGPNGLGGPQNEACISVTAGQIYAVNVSQFSPSPNGYTIDFSASSASIFDNTSPAIQTVNTPIFCGDGSLTFSFSESVLCNTLQSSDLQLSGPGGPYSLSGLTGAACASGGTQEITFTISVSPAILSGGNFNLCLVSNSGVTDLCGNVAPSACLPFPVAGLTITPGAITNVNCFGGTNGSATVSASGGNPPYTFSWNTAPIQTGTTATGLSGGNYTVTATDADGCSGNTTINITEPFVIPLKFDVSCDSLGCDGSASVSPVGGTAPYSYQWYDVNMIAIPGETTSSISNLCAGAWCVVTTDFNSCRDTTCVTIQLPAITITAFQTGCIGTCDGAASVTAIGGVAPYTYQWQNPLGVSIPFEIDSFIDTVCAGPYYLQVNTGNGCTLTDSVTVLEPAVIAGIISSSKNTCFGACDGSAMLTASGGTPPYTYSWTDPDSQTTAQATGLCIGNYTVYLTDSKGCGPDTSTVSIAENPQMNSITSVVHTNCDTVNGSATVVVTGGTSPYTYQWDNPSNSTLSNATGLPAGTFMVVVSDSIDCKDTSIVNIGYVDSNTATITVTKPISCSGICDGEIDVVITGGNPPYTYAWSTKEVTPSIDSLCPDTFSVTASDTSGCPATASIVLTEPAPITSGITGTDETSCNSTDGAIDLTPSGGTSPYSFSWSNGASTEDLSGLSAGTYTVTVMDAENCPADTNVFTLNQPPPISISLIPKDVSCNGGSDGSVDLTVVSGGTAPYTYTWSNGASTEDINGLTAGLYNASVTDINNCPVTSGPATVAEPEPINTSLSKTCINGEGAITSSTTGGTPPYDYQWSTGSAFSDISGLQPGTYSVTVTDVNNCPPDVESMVILPCSVSIPTAFTPNGNGVNDFWDVKNLEYFKDVKVRVYNRWGDLIFSSTGYDTPWDGRERITNAELPTAVYYYVIENLDPKFIETGSSATGYVTLVK